jgi:hypothetical protein
MLSKREKIIALVTVLVIGALIGDRYVLTPLMGKLNQWATRSQELQAELDEIQTLFKRRALMERKWRQMAGDGLTMGVESESRVLHALDRWSQDAGITLTSVKPLQSTQVKDTLHEKTFTVAGVGPLRATAEFIWQIEQATLPLRIRNLQMGSANESGSEMSLQLSISTLTLAEPGGKDAS